MATGVLFPGQGAQKVGMGLSLLERDPSLRSYLDTASKIVGWDVLALIKDGPQEELNRTDKSQVAILVVSWISYKVFEKEKGRPDLTAGLSLGEYGALLCAEVLDFESAVRLVDIRGRLMQEESERNPSGMLAVIGLDEETLSRAIEGLEIYPANFNAPGQIVVSGRKEDLAVAEERLRSAGAKRIVPLAVAGGFHSPIMARAQERLNEYIEKVEFSDPKVEFYSSVSGERVSSGEEIKQLLMRQLVSPTLWQKVAETVCERADVFFEMEPSGVLRSLMKKVCAKPVERL